MSLLFEALQRLEGGRARAGSPDSKEAIEVFRRSEDREMSRWENALNRKDVDGRPAEIVEKARPRVVGTPIGLGRLMPTEVAAPTIYEVAPAAAEKKAPGEGAAAIHDAVATLCGALPSFVQRILPLFERSSDAPVFNQSDARNEHTHETSLELAHVEANLVEMKTQHGLLFDRVEEQNVSIRRVEDRLDMVREATDRNTLEQKELFDELRGVGKKLNMLAVFTMVLLAVSIVLDVILYLHMPAH